VNISATRVAVGRPTMMVTSSRGGEVVTPRRLVRPLQLCARGKLRRAGMHHGKGSEGLCGSERVRRRPKTRKRDEPHGWKRAEIRTHRRNGSVEGPKGSEGCRVEEEAVEVVKNCEDGTWRRVGALFPKGIRSRLACDG